jgi:predicted transcriptional regulator
MMCVETIGKVRRDHFVLGKSIKEICRTRGLSRGTVRKVLRSETTAFTYERQKQPYPRLGPWIDRLEDVLVENEKRPKKERFPLPDKRMEHSLRRGHADLG